MRAIIGFVIITVAAHVKATSEPVDIFKLSNNAIDDCVEDKAEQEKFRSTVFNAVLPENDDEFVKFYECYCRKLRVLDEHGNINFDVVRATFPEVIRRKISDKVDAEKLTHDAIEHCEKEPISGAPGFIAIKRRNCGNKYVNEHLN